MCTKCGKEKAIVQLGSMFLCDACGTEHSKTIYKLTMEDGGKGMTKEEGVVDDKTMQEFPQKNRPQVVGCEIVWIYNDGTSKLIRTTLAEQIRIIEKIRENRVYCKKTFEFLDCVVWPLDMAKEATEIIKELRQYVDDDGTPIDISELASRALALFPEEGIPMEEKEETDGPVANEP
jgi:hypothetical protein